MRWWETVKKWWRRNYDAAKNDRLGGNWQPVSKLSAEETDRPYRSALLYRARDLERNSDIVESAINGIIRNAIGANGIIPQAHVNKASGAPNERLNDAIEELWREWSRPEHCDASGAQSFAELQSMILRRRIVDGEIFVRKIISKNGRFPLKLQVFEPDQLDTMRQGPRIHEGIEVDEYLRPVAYYFLPDALETPLYNAGNSIKVPADQIIHLFNKKRPSQIHGLSELAIVMNRIRDTGEFIDAELVAARIAACFALFVTKQNPSGFMGTGRSNFETDARGNPLKTIEPGMIEILAPGESVIEAKPNHPNTGAGEFVSLQQRLAAAGLGQSYEMLSRDLSKVSYSSVRQGHLEDRKSFEMFQKYLVIHLCVPVWEAFLTSAVLAGLVKIPDFERNKSRYIGARWITPGWQWVDPLKEVNASTQALLIGASTLEEICGQKGLDWQEVLKQRARELEYASTLGINLNTEPGKEVNDVEEEPEEEQGQT